MSTAARDFWDAQALHPTNPEWMDDPQVRAYINAAIGGDVPAWPLEWFARTIAPRRFGRVLSIGCGTGAFERSLADLGICDRIDAFDGSLGAIASARAAARPGDRITYFVSDFNRPALPRHAYDAIFFHQSLHHVGKLERLLREVMSALRPGGLLYVDEYVGPSVLDWDDHSIAQHRAIYDSLPDDIRLTDPLPFPIVPADPSEAIRSAEILPQLAIGFEEITRRDYGGNLLSVLLPNIRRDAALVRELIERERAVIRSSGETYYTVRVYRARRGFAARAASLRYLVTPKIRRIRYEFFKRIGRPRKF